MRRPTSSVHSDGLSGKSLEGDHQRHDEALQLFRVPSLRSPAGPASTKFFQSTPLPTHHLLSP